MLSSLRQPRTYVKFAASQLWFITCTTASTAAIDTVFDPQTKSAEDNVEAVGFMVGTAIWWQTEHLVKRPIDKAADWRLARKAAKQNAEAVA